MQRIFRRRRCYDIQMRADNLQYYSCMYVVALVTSIVSLVFSFFGPHGLRPQSCSARKLLPRSRILCSKTDGPVLSRVLSRRHKFFKFLLPPERLVMLMRRAARHRQYAILWPLDLPGYVRFDKVRNKRTSETTLPPPE